MALSSASTLDDALAQWKNNLLWEGDFAKAQNALEAARFILMCRPKVLSEGDVHADFEAVAAMIPRLEAFVGAATTTRKAHFVKGRPQYY